MPTELEIEAACRAMYGSKWDGAPSEAPGEAMKRVWRQLASKALEGAEKERKKAE